VNDDQQTDHAYQEGRLLLLIAQRAEMKADSDQIPALDTEIAAICDLVRSYRLVRAAGDMRAAGDRRNVTLRKAVLLQRVIIRRGTFRLSPGFRSAASSEAARLASDSVSDCAVERSADR
jgi:hypothetical protein